MAVTRLPTKLVNAPLTIFPNLAGGGGRAHLAWRAMAKRNSKAGGLFLTIGSLGGFGWGIGAGEPLAGALLGTALGAAAALLLWLLDRRP